MYFCVFCFVLSQYATICFIKTIENCLRLVCQLSTNSWSKFPMVSSSMIPSPFGTRFYCIRFDKKSLCELYLADFSFKWVSFIASPSVLWFCDGAAVKRFELILPSSWIIVEEEVFAENPDLDTSKGCNCEESGFPMNPSKGKEIAPVVSLIVICLL